MENLAFSADLIRAIIDLPPNPHLESFDATGYAASAWPESLKPIGTGAVQCESFAEWWNRHKITLAHLHPMIAEQWLYRHWIWSPYRNLPLDQLVWRQELWKTRRILEEVFRRPQFGKLQPAFDYEVFHGKYFEPCLIEGHQRVRYLNALSARGECAAEHCVFLLSIEDRGLGYSAPYPARKSAGQRSAMSA